MRYLQNRSQFLDTKVDLDVNRIPELYKKSSLIKEVTGAAPFGNEITWGGSLIGRLFNSAWRKIRIGFNSVQIPNLLKKLTAELDYLVYASIKGDMKEKMDSLMLKGYMELIKTTSLEPSSQGNIKTELEILNKLLGFKSMCPGVDENNITNQSSQNIIKQNLYDPNDPTKNQRTEGRLQDVLDTLTDDFPDLKEIIGVNRDVILDTISDYNDRLRKYAYELTGGAAGGDDFGAEASVQRFQANFSQIVNAIVSPEEGYRIR